MSAHTLSSIVLADWLVQYRADLLARWLHAAANTAPAPHDEYRDLLPTLYDAIVAAEQGDHAPLTANIRLLRESHAMHNEHELSEHLAHILLLKRVAMTFVFEHSSEPSQTYHILVTLDQRVDDIAVALTHSWVESAHTVMQQLQQTEQLLESLNDATDEADRLVLQVASLNDLAAILASSLDADHLMMAIGEKLVEVLEEAQITIWLPHANGLRAAYASGTNEVSACLLATAGNQTDVVLRAFKSGAPILEDAPAPAGQGPWYIAGANVLAVPLIAHAQVSGVLALQIPAETQYIGRNLESFVRSAASQIAIALQNAWLYEEVRDFNTALEQRITERTEELQTERDMLETLNQISFEASSTLDVTSLLENCLDLLAGIIGVAHGSVMLVEPETGHLVDRAVLGGDGKVGYTRFPLGQGVAGWVAQHRQPTIVSNIETDPRWVTLPNSDKQRGKRTGSMIAAPLVIQNDAIGVLIFSQDQPDYFNDGHVRLLNASAGEIALGIHNALLYEQIQQQLWRQGEMLRNERRLTTQSTAILQSLSDGVIVCDTEGIVITANPAVVRILNRSIEELMIWNLCDLLSRLLGEEAQRLSLMDLMLHPNDVEGRPRSLSHRFRIDTRVVRLTLDPVITTEEEVMGAVAVLRDITREVESERLKDQFIGTVSHELRTPMTSIKGYTQLLSMGSLGPVNDSQRAFLNTVHTNAERMISIINDLLDITKIETGSIELDLRPLLLAETLGNVALELQSSITAHRHELIINLPSELPMVQVDARRFGQVLVNLVSNAIKYTPDGGRITIEARQGGLEMVPASLRDELRTRRYVCVCVRDTGVGIAPEEHAQIFERFYRAENPLRIEAGGTGLGLSLVRPLIRLFGGRIWVESAVDQGSAFSFVVPVAGG